MPLGFNPAITAMSYNSGLDMQSLNEHRMALANKASYLAMAHQQNNGSPFNPAYQMAINQIATEDKLTAMQQAKALINYEVSQAMQSNKKAGLSDWGKSFSLMA